MESSTNSNGQEQPTSRNEFSENLMHSNSNGGLSNLAATMGRNNGSGGTAIALHHHVVGSGLPYGIAPNCASIQTE